MDPGGRGQPIYQYQLLNFGSRLLSGAQAAGKERIVQLASAEGGGRRVSAVCKRSPILLYFNSGALPIDPRTEPVATHLVCPRRKILEREEPFALLDRRVHLVDNLHSGCLAALLRWRASDGNKMDGELQYRSIACSCLLAR